MSLPYRTQRALSRLCVTLLVLLLIAAVALLCWLLWLNRFVLYTKDGVKLDFDLEQELIGGQIAQSQPIPEVSIDYQETLPTEPESTDLKQFSGYYISYAELSGNLAGVRAKVEQLPAGTPVMLDLKSIRGEFYYTSSQGRLSTKVDVAGIDELLAYMRVKDLYVIARIPAFRDYYYGLGHVAHGLIGDPVKVSLWMDSERCYWLNPDKEGTIISQPTMQIEVPKLYCENNMQTGIPAGGKAYFTLELQNNSEIDCDTWYNLSVVEESNPHGAQLLVDGLSVNGLHYILYRNGGLQ